MFVCERVALRVFKICKLSGIRLDLACNLIVLLFRVSTLHCISLSVSLFLFYMDLLILFLLSQGSRPFAEDYVNWIWHRMSMGCWSGSHA